MKQQSSTILYLFIGLIILSGLALFIFKDQITENLLTDNFDTVSVKRSEADFKLDILQDSRIKELKNYVSVFDYNNLEKSQEIISGNYNSESNVVISNPDDETTVSTSTKKTNQKNVRVRVGNSNPFLVKKAVK